MRRICQYVKERARVVAVITAASLVAGVASATPPAFNIELPFSPATVITAVSAIGVVILFALAAPKIAFGMGKSLISAVGRIFKPS